MEEESKKETIEMTDNRGMLKRGTTIFKAKSHKGVKMIFEEIELEEYDKRVNDLAVKIAKMPEVDLMGALKDALYDMTLDRLTKVEKMLEKELEKEKPQVKTTSDQTYRGTCVNLAIGGKFAVELRH